MTLLSNDAIMSKLMRYNKGLHRTYERLSKWDTELTTKDNAKALALHYEAANSLRLKYHLVTQPGRKNMGKRGKGGIPLDAKLCGLLRIKGFTYESIGMLYGVSRQHVEATLRRKGG